MYVRLAPYILASFTHAVYAVPMAKGELEATLDFILNRANEAEFEVLAKACERRRRDMGKYAGLGGMNPGVLAERMAASLNGGVEETMGGLRDTVRSLVERIIRQNAPEATAEQVDALLRHYVPDPQSKQDQAPDPLESALPPEAVVMMLKDFLDYSTGAMLPSKQKELWDTVPSWQEKYWDAFPPVIKGFVKARLEDRLDEAEFWKAALSVLGL